MLTPGLHDIRKSSSHEVMADTFGKWVQENLGAGSTGQVKHAPAMIYPDQNHGSRPKIPNDPDIEKITIAQLRAWLRTFFNYLYLWQGGKRSVPWKAVSSDTRHRYIAASCMPPGIRQLIDPGDMTRALLETWYKWLLAGQEGRLRPEQIFQFALVELGGNSIPLTYTEPITGRPKNCRLVWTPQEKTYAQKVTSDALDALQKPAWLDLPPARLQEVYAPFSGTVKTQMSNACLSEYQAGALTSLVFSIEHYGPVHTREVGIQEPLNRYIAEDMTEASLENLLNEQLHVGALLEDEPLHAELSLSSFIHYAKTNVRFRHARSQTWRAGPYGIRWLLAIYIHLACAFSMFEIARDELSTDIVLAFEACSFKRLKSSLVRFGDWLKDSINESIATLKRTFKERGEAWRRAVVSTYLSHPDDNIGNESVRLDTHGIPRSKATLRACYECLQEQDPDITFGHDQDRLEFVHQRRLSRRRINWEDAELSDRESDSGEEIDIPDFGSDDDDESEDQEDSFRDPGDREPPVLHSTGIRDISHLLTQVPQHLPSTEMDPANQSSDDLSFVAAEVQHVTLSTADSSDFEPLSQKLRAGSPTFLSGDVAHAALKSDSEDETQVEFPRTILTDISPVKLKPVSSQSKPQSKMEVEVVIPTPRKPRASPTSLGSSQQAPAGEPPKDELDESVARRRPKRSIGRSAQAAEAIRLASKEKGRSGPKAFDVQRTGARGAVRVTETAASKAGVSTPFTFSESSPACTDVDQLVAAELANDPAFPNVQPSDQPLDNEMEELRVELEAEIEDTADTYVHSPTGGQGQNEMLQEWSEKWSQLFLSELYRKYDSPENTPCL
ncbi:hypothetical protein FRC11_011135, partial [Ceratobasidium sp. 423]